MFSTLKKNPLFLFLSRFFLLFAACFAVYELWLHREGSIDGAIINNTIFFSQKLLHLFGYHTFTSTTDTVRVIGIDGTHGLWIGDPCDGLSLFALFTCLIVSYPGSAKNKLWFIPAGLVLIHFLNILRITILCIIVLKSPSALEFNHTYTFQLLVYGFIFLLWMIWVNKYGKSESRKWKVESRK